MKFILFFLVFILNPVFAFSQGSASWDLLYNKKWKLVETSILRPTKPNLRPIIEFSLNKPSLMDLSKMQVEFRQDGNLTGIDAAGNSYSDTWKFEGSMSIWIGGDDKPSQVTKLTDTELVLQIPQIYKSVFNDADEFVVSQYKFATDNPLPVTLSYFSVHKLDNKNTIIAWKTTNEINADRFEIEHSTDAKNFKHVGKLDAVSTGKQNQSYSFIHSGINSSIPNYYRLKMIDKDETFAYSSIQSVNGSDTGEKIFPNPVVDELNIEVKNWTNVQSVTFLI